MTAPYLNCDYREWRGFTRTGTGSWVTREEVEADVCGLMTVVFGGVWSGGGKKSEVTRGNRQFSGTFVCSRSAVIVGGDFYCLRLTRSVQTCVREALPGDLPYRHGRALLVISATDVTNNDGRK